MDIPQICSEDVPTARLLYEIESYNLDIISAVVEVN